MFYKVALWTVLFTFYDNSCVVNNSVVSDFCGTTNTTFYLRSQCDVNTPFIFSSPTFWRVTDVNAMNLTNGLSSIYYDYAASRFQPIAAYPPDAASYTTGVNVFEHASPAKQAGVSLTVTGALGFSSNASSMYFLSVSNGVSAPYTDPTSGSKYFSVSLPAGVGGSRGNLVSLYYDVFDGCAWGQTVVPFSFFAVCNRTLSNSAVVNPAIAYWQGASNKFQVRSS